jgi:hypothetical protein
MAAPRRRRLIAMSIVAVALITLVIAANAILSHWLNKTISSTLASKHVSYDDLSVNIFTRSVTIDHIRWNADSMRQTNTASLATIDLRGISIWSFLFDGQIEANQLLIEGGDLNLSSRTFQSTRTTGDTTRITGDTTKIAFQSLLIDKIVFNSIHFVIGDSLPAYSATLNGVISGMRQDSLQAWKDPTSYRTQNIQFDISDLSISPKDSPYRVRIDRTDFDREAGKMTIDCLFVEPLKSKYEFARAFGKQVSRTELTVTSIQLSKINISRHLNDTTVTVGEIVIDQPKLHAFKDKRLPFIRDHNVPLPMEQFRALPWAIEIDTMKIRNAYIAYEEFPENGFKTGTVFFSELNAVFGGLMNRDYSPEKYATLNTDSKFMGSGRLRATFLFPLKEDHPYQASATLSSMPLADMNTMLENVAFTSVQAGRLNKLRLMFNYNEFTSKGDLNIDYKDLKLQTLNKDAGSSVNQIKSVIVNAALKNDTQQTGSIDILRDRKRYIFHFWAHSALDGIKSAVMPRAVKNANDRATERRSNK